MFLFTEDDSFNFLSTADDIQQKCRKVRTCYTRERRKTATCSKGRDRCRVYQHLTVQGSTRCVSQTSCFYEGVSFKLGKGLVLLCVTTVIFI